jgi:hypothetical protein
MNIFKSLFSINWFKGVKAEEALFIPEHSNDDGNLRINGGLQVKVGGTWETAGNGAGITPTLQDITDNEAGTAQTTGDIEAENLVANGTVTAGGAIAANGDITTGGNMNVSHDLFVTDDIQVQGDVYVQQTVYADKFNGDGSELTNLPDIDSSKITDFVEAVQDAVGAFFGAGSNVNVTYDDAANTITVSASGGSSNPEDIRDAIGAALIGAGLINVVVNDAGDTITISTTATANSSDATLLSRSNHTGTQLSSTISDFAIAARAVLLTGLSLATGTAIADTDSLIVALGKLQKQVSDRLQLTGGTITGQLFVSASNPTAGNTQVGRLESKYYTGVANNNIVLGAETTGAPNIRIQVDNTAAHIGFNIGGAPSSHVTAMRDGSGNGYVSIRNAAMANDATYANVIGEMVLKMIGTGGTITTGTGSITLSPATGLNLNAASGNDIILSAAGASNGLSIRKAISSSNVAYNLYNTGDGFAAFIQWMDGSMQWGPGGASARDVGLRRSASGTLEINSTTAGTLRDLTCRHITMTSTTGGLLLPRMTKVQRDAISSPAQGLMVFVTDNGGYLSLYNSGWQKINSTAD